MTNLYDPKQVSLVVAGQNITGFADGTYINAERESDSFTDIAGADGEVTRSKMNDRRGNIVVTLRQGSPSNDIFSALLAADELNNSGVFSVLCKDNSGTSFFAAAKAWIQKHAASEFAKEAGSREWTIRCSQLDIFVGGNVEA